MWGDNSTFDASGSSSSSSPSSSSTSASLRDGSGGSGGGDAMLRSLRRNQHWKLTDRPGVDLMAAGSDVLRETGQVRPGLGGYKGTCEEWRESSGGRTWGRDKGGR